MGAMLLCITHEIDRLASADSDFVVMCVHQTWVVLMANNNFDADNDTDFVGACTPAH